MGKGMREGVEIGGGLMNMKLVEFKLENAIH